MTNDLKSPQEIALMREAGLLVWQAHQVAAALVKPGVSTGEINAAVENCLRIIMPRHFSKASLVQRLHFQPPPVSLSTSRLYTVFLAHVACKKATLSALTLAAGSTAGVVTLP